MDDDGSISNVEGGFRSFLNGPPCEGLSIEKGGKAGFEGERKEEGKG